MGLETRTLPRLVVELVWTLRREGFAIAPSQAIDLLRAFRALGWDDHGALQEATASIVLQEPRHRPKLQHAFTAFFAQRATHPDLWARLNAQGFTAAELELLRELLDGIRQRENEDGQASLAFPALLEGGFDMDRLLRLAGIRRELEGLRNPLQIGFVMQRAARALGVHAAYERLQLLRQSLRNALGPRGDALADSLARELDRAANTLRDHLRSESELRRSQKRGRDGDKKAVLEELPFTSLNDREFEDVRAAVRVFVQRLRGAASVRARRARRGRVDINRTMRLTLRTGGVPFRPVRRDRRRDRPRLILLCDVSESVRTASRFMLELVYAAHDLFARTRSFVFVSELGESTALFELQPLGVALVAAYGGDVVPVTDNSNYGRVLRAFEAHHLGKVDRRTTVVILGDGRTNYHDAGEQSLARIRARARSLYWFCSEPRAGWSSGDSAMPRYVPHCTKVLEVTTARELEDAARILVSTR